MIAFNKKFKQEWPQESGTVFDTNVYTTGHMPASSLSNRGQQYSQMNAVRSNLKDIEKLQQKLQELREGMKERTTQTAINKARRMERQLERLISEKKTEIRETLTQINNLRNASGEKPISASSVINAETTSEAIKTVDSSLNTMRTDLKGKIDAENETKLVGLSEDALGQMARDQKIMSLVKMKRFMTDAEWQHYSDMMREAGADESLFAEAKTVSDALGQKLHDRKDSLPDTVRDAENHAANRLYEETLAELIPNLNRLNELREKYKGQELENIPSQDLLEIQTLNTEVKQIQSQALFFANEAYHTGGPVEHVVLNQQMRLGLEVEPKDFSLSVNEQTGFIMEQTEKVKTDEDFGKSLWKSAKYLDRICDAAEKLGEIESRTDMAVKETKIEEQIEAVTDPDLKEVYKLREIAVELLKIKKNPVMNDAEKSEEALKIVKKIGWTGVAQYRQKMLDLNKILNERIQVKINNAET